MGIALLRKACRRPGLVRLYNPEVGLVSRSRYRIPVRDRQPVAHNRNLGQRRDFYHHLVRT